MNQQEVEQCINWIIKKSIDKSATSAKGLYLCAILGHLAVTCSCVKDLKLLKNEDTKLACDFLLNSLVMSFRKKMLNSPKISKLLEAIAPELVSNSSSPGWLTFAANFLPHYGMEPLVEMEIASPKYEPENYMRLYHMVMSHDIPRIRNAREEDQPHYIRFLTRILKLAPDEGTLFKVFASKEITPFFHDYQDRERFCIEFYKDHAPTSGEENVSVSEKLQQLTNLPRNLRLKLSGLLYSYLLQFIKSVENPTKNDLDNFMDIQFSLNLNNDQIETILTLLSTSLVDSYQELLLQLLNDNKFRLQWGNVKRTTKAIVCEAWVKARACGNDINKAKVSNVYQAAEELISCQLVNKDLKKKLMQSVKEWLFQIFEPKDIFKELKDLEKFKQHDVRESCIHLIEEVLRNKLRIVNDQRLLSELSHSR